MLKKIFLLVLTAMIILAFLLAICSSNALANSKYTPFLNGDPDYIHCAAHLGISYYVVRDSVEIESYTPAGTIISVDLLHVEVKGQSPPFEVHEEPIITRTETVYYLFDQENEKMYYLDNDEWRFLQPGVSSWAHGRKYVYAGDVVFYLIYGEGFYLSEDQFEDIDN